MKTNALVLQRTVLTATLCLCCIASTTVAHDFFIIATPVELAAPDEFMVQMHVTEAFPGESVEWRADKVVHIVAIGPQGKAPLMVASPKCGPSGAIVTTLQPGLHLVSLTVSPSSITLDGADFNGYIRHEGHDALLETRRKAGIQEQSARERYSRFVKTIVQVGDAKVAHAKHIASPTGQRIEIVPLVVTSKLRPGGALPVRVLYDGKPLANALVSATHENFKPDDSEHGEGHYAFSNRTDDQGQITIPIIRTGLQLIRVTHMVELPEDKDFDYESFWASLTFHVAGKSPAPARGSR